MSQGFLLVISGPSGCGKGTVSKVLLEQNSDIIFSISSTTRKKRIGEEDGVNYFFVDEEDFRKKVKEDKFLEHAFVHNNYYGTPRDFVLKEIEKGEIVLLEIDVQGAMQVKKNYKNVVFVFLLPPSMAELKDRITKRGTETPEAIQTRFENAFEELNFVGEYDYFVVNDKVENAVLDIQNIIRTEKLRVKRHSNIKEKIISQEGGK